MPTRLSERLRNDNTILSQILTSDPEALPLDERCRMLQAVRAGSDESSQRADRYLIAELLQARGALVKSREVLEQLKEKNQQLTEPPWFTGTFACTLPDENKAMVWYSSNLRVVSFAEGLSGEMFEVGDEVFLNAELNVCLRKSPYNRPTVGETGVFERYEGDGRLVLRVRDQEIAVEPCTSLSNVELTRGDIILWDKRTWIAQERLEREEGKQYFLTELPDAHPGQVGGQRHVLRRLLNTLTTSLGSEKKARRYLLDERQTVLLVGPPGCGKTLMVRVVAAEITRMGGEGGKPCYVAVVKPAEWEDPYVGVTQQKIRECFRALREAAQDAYVLLYLDEIEAIGRHRGTSIGNHGDKFLAAFLAELDGFASRGGVAIVASTNKKELIDGALLERLSDLEIHVGRPDMRSAREIFEIHLPESLPFSPNGSVAMASREALIERAVSRLYAPNADNELCTMQFRDGKTRTISSRELVSGRLIEQICRAARQSACQRDIQLGDAGVRLEDIDEAVSDAIDRLSSTLTPRNARLYIVDLPQDIDVVSVEPIRRPTRRAHRYLKRR